MVGVYEFVGWYTADGTDGNWGDEVTIENSFPAGGATYYAKWRNTSTTTITFYDGDEQLGERYEYAYEELVDGSKVNVPAVAESTHPGYEFIGWSLNRPDRQRGHSAVR